MLHNLKHSSVVPGKKAKWPRVAVHADSCSSIACHSAMMKFSLFSYLPLSKVISQFKPPMLVSQERMMRPPLDTVIASAREKTNGRQSYTCSVTSYGPWAVAHLWLNGCKQMLCRHLSFTVRSIPSIFPIRLYTKESRNGRGGRPHDGDQQASAYPVHEAAWHPQPLLLCPCQHGATLKDMKVWHSCDHYFDPRKLGKGWGLVCKAVSNFI